MIETEIEEKQVRTEKAAAPKPPPEADSIELRSEELQEMLSRPPSWLTRWGAGLFCAVLFLIILLSWFIKSPDKIIGSFTLTTENPPTILTTRISGKIQKLLVSDNASVRQHDVIAEIENPAGMESVRYLEALTTQMLDYASSETPDTNIPFDSNMTFGDAQNDYNILLKSYQDHRELTTNPYYRERIEELRSQLKWQTELLSINVKQSRIFERQLENAKTKFSIEERLHQENVNSDLEYIQQQDVWLEKLMQQENFKKAIVQGEMTVGDLRKQIRQLEFEFDERDREYKLKMLESIKNLRNYIRQWQQTYTVRATSAGMLSYLKPLYNNQYVRMEEELFAIVQDQDDYVAFATVSSMGAGKVKIGQRVRLKLDNFPYQQFGSLDGVVGDISLLPLAERGESGGATNSSYRITISLSNKLVTNYGKQLSFKPNMTGQAEILTDDLRLLERIFYNIRKAVDQ